MTLVIVTLVLHLIFHLIAMSTCWTALSATFEKYNYCMKKIFTLIENNFQRGNDEEKEEVDEHQKIGVSSFM